MVKLAPMTEEEFARYLGEAIPHYAQAHLETGDCDPAEALALAQADYATLLPTGLASPRQHLFSIVDAASGERVGMIWFALDERSGRKSAFIYDLVVFEPHRGKGYGTRALEAVEEEVARRGAARLSLNVMGHNRVARALYEKRGFSITGIGMTKRVG